MLWGVFTPYMMSDTPFVVGILVCLDKSMNRASHATGATVVVVAVVVMVVVIVVVSFGTLSRRFLFLDFTYMHCKV